MDPEVAGSTPVIHPIHFRFENAGVEASLTWQYELLALYDSLLSHPSSQRFQHHLRHQLQVERPGIAKIDIGVPWPEARKRFENLDFSMGTFRGEPRGCHRNPADPLLDQVLDIPVLQAL